MSSTDLYESHGACTRPYERSMAFNEALIDVLGTFNTDFVGGTDFRTLFDTLLANFLQLTESEYGFIGELLKKADGTPYLRTHAITNIAWNAETLRFFQENVAKGLEFHNLKTLFGRVMEFEQGVISNHPASDPRAGGLPERHPPLDAFLGVPLFLGSNFVGMVGVANRPGGYDEGLAAALRPLCCLTAAMIEAVHLNRLRATQLQIVHTEKMAAIGTLTAGVAHEINNPANFAHAGAQALGADLQRFHDFLLELAGDDASPEVRSTITQRVLALTSQVDLVLEGTQRIRGLVRDLRTFSRLDEADVKSVAIGDSLMSTVHLVRTQYLHAVDIRCNLAANPVLECRPAQLNQVFMNLIVNACHGIQARQRACAEPHAGQLDIRSRIEDGNLLIEFEDNGTGIPRHILGRIFEPFFTTKDVGEGSGLGLAISFGIVEKHQGAITVRSVEGEGTCFTVRLPLTPQVKRSAHA
ncbi:MAG TPA: ATP-binding protein [Burkholderiaceae bacterium]